MLINHFFSCSFDILNRERLSGWIYRRFNKTRPVFLNIYLDTFRVGDILADGYRQDLMTQGLHPNGRCGFNFIFPKDIDIGHYSYLRICDHKGRQIYACPTNAIPDIFRDELPRIFFMHIPKTAGTSFNTFIRQHYPDGLVSTHIESLPESKYPELVREKCFLGGHFRLETLLKNFDPDNYCLYTIIRNPHRHLHSNLNWLRGGLTRPADEVFRNYPQNLQEFGRKLGSAHLDVKSTLGTIVNNLSEFECELFDNRQTRHFLDYKPLRVGQEDLEQAIINLRLFTDVGLTEKYEEFLKRFCLRHDLKYIKQESLYNRSRFRALYDITEVEMQRLLEPLVAYDLQLYEAAAEIFKNHES